MNPILLTREQVEQLNYKQCQKAFKNLNREYSITRPISECFDVVWPILDQLADTVNLLEERIWQYEHPSYTSLTIE